MNKQSQIQAELEKAGQARLLGNEGRARVCARRAAGLAARAYLLGRGRAVRTSSAYDLLRLLAVDSELPQGITQAATHLTLPVDEQFTMPVGVDLIGEAQQLCDYLSKHQWESRDPKDPAGL